MIKIMTMKEKIENMIGSFLDRNKDYAVELYITNAVTNASIGTIFITSDRISKADDKKFTLEWNKDKYYDVRYNDFSLPYDEIMRCYEEVEKDDKLKITEAVVIILKNGMEFKISCAGMRI